MTILYVFLAAVTVLGILLGAAMIVGKALSGTTDPRFDQHPDESVEEPPHDFMDDDIVEWRRERYGEVANVVAYEWEPIPPHEHRAVARALLDPDVEVAEAALRRVLPRPVHGEIAPHPRIDPARN